MIGTAPAERLATVRAAVFAYAAVYVAVRSPVMVDTSDLDPQRFDPVGGVAWLESPLPIAALALFVLVAVVASVAAAIGWRYRYTAPIAAIAVLVALSHRMSWGQVLHTENLIVFHAAILALAPAAAAWSLDSRRAQIATCHRGATLGSHLTVTPRGLEGSSDRQLGSRQGFEYAWALWLLSAVTVSTYVIAAWAKLRAGGLDWISGDVLRSHIAHDNLRKHLLGDPSSPFAGLVVPQGWLFAPMALAAMAIELIAPIAVLGWRRARHIWVATAWLFHLAVLALMAIVFPYQLLGIAFLSFVDAEKLVEWVGGLISRRS